VFFGIKFRKGDFGYQKVLTTEYSESADDFKGKEIVSKVYLKDVNKYKYKLYCYFADYPTPREAFLAHSKLLLSARYKHALQWNNDPVQYLFAIWTAGYATDVNYGAKMQAMVRSIEKRL